MLISPGKGLLLYSPLVILGLFGFRDLWRADRQLGGAIAITFLASLIVISGSSQWSEDTWGPRYLVASAWLLVLPIAWWTRGRVRCRTLAAVAAVAIVVQFAGVFSWYGVSVKAARTFSGQPVYPFHGGFTPNQVAYGDEAPTWIPAVSELRFQVELLAAWVKEKVTGTGFTISYRPFWGRSETVNLTHPEQFVGVPLPDFWWNFPGATNVEWVLPPLLAMASLASIALLAIAVPPRRRNLLADVGAHPPRIISR
jgi:hypothetical protein